MPPSEGESFAHQTSFSAAFSYLTAGACAYGATVRRVLAITVASELAAARPDVKGSGTFLPALIDELGTLTPEKMAQYANIEVI